MINKNKAIITIKQCSCWHPIKSVLGGYYCRNCGRAKKFLNNNFTKIDKKEEK